MYSSGGSPVGSAPGCLRELRPGLFTWTAPRPVYAVPLDLHCGLYANFGPGRGLRPSSPLIPVSHYAPGHSDAGSRRDNIRRHIGFRHLGSGSDMGAAILASGRHLGSSSDMGVAILVPVPVPAKNI